MRVLRTPRRHGGSEGKRLRAAVMCTILLCTLMLSMSVAASAAETAGAKGDASLTIRWEENGLKLCGGRFHVYRVAEVTEDGGFALTGGFRNYPVALAGLDSAGWRKAAETLAGYAAADALPAERSGTTDENGEAYFGGLRTGLYLIVGERLVVAGKYHIAPPSLVSLPGKDADGNWTYDMIVKPKSESGDDTTVSLQVLKVWNDAGTSRPAEITVQLLGNGAVIDTVVLNLRNNWRYEWTGLDGKVYWQVIEKPVPDGYTITISREGHLITLTNTKPGKPPQGDPTLPQTGLNWWPVWGLTAAGLVLFLVGWRCWRREKQK